MKITNQRYQNDTLPLRDVKHGAVIRFPDGVYGIGDAVMKVRRPEMPKPKNYRPGHHRTYPGRYRPSTSQFFFVVSLKTGRTYRLPGHFATKELDASVHISGDKE